MRPRLIDPGIWQDKQFAPLSIDAQQLFFGFITLADDYGKVKASESELKMRLHPWGNYSLENITIALKELLTTDLVVCYHEDHYFVPSWFEHQTIRFPARSKIHDVPDDFLKMHKKYREAAADARMKSRHPNKPLKVKKAMERPEGGWTHENWEQAIDLDQELNKDKVKSNTVLDLAKHYSEDLSAVQIKEYLDVMERYSSKQCKSCVARLKKKYGGKAIPYPDKLESELHEMFGDGASIEAQANLTEVKSLLSRSYIVETQEFLSSLNEKQRAGVMSWVWSYLAKLAGGEDNLPVIINNIYGDMDMKWERVHGIWEHIRANTNKAGCDEEN